MTSNGERDGLSAEALNIEVRGETLLVGVRVMPSAARTELRGVYGDRLKVAVNAPPEAGKANARLVEALADWLDLRLDQVNVQVGHGGRDKVIAFSGTKEQELRGRLSVLLHSGKPIR